MKAGYILTYFVAAMALIGCRQEEIPVYDVKDSAVFFKRASIEFSLKGNKDPEPEIRIPLEVFGPVCGYDRVFQVAIPDSSYNDAVLGRDFEILSSKVPAGAMEGEIVIRVKALTGETPTRTVAMEILPDENFPHCVKERECAKVSWSKDFVRPDNQYARQAWYYFFCNGYSKALHELLYEYFGEEIERSGYSNGAMKDENSVYHVNTWWYGAQAEFYDFVKTHDIENPDSPYMHSADYEIYTYYSQETGTGIKPSVIPSILSTLIH